MSKKSKKQKVNIKLIALSFFVAIGIYFLGNLIKLLRNPTETMLIKNGELINSEEVEGYIIRDEVLIDTSECTGMATAQVEDSTRIAKNGIILSYATEKQVEYEQKIAELDIKIQEALSNQTSILSNDIKVLDSEIQQKLYSMYNIKNDMYEIAEHKNIINSKIEKKAKIIGKLSPSGSRISELINERASYESKINNAKKELKSNIAGLVSYRVDGLETVLTKDKLSTLTIDELERLNLITNHVIPVNVENVKIIDNFECYICMSLDSQSSMNAKLNDKVYIRFNESEKYDTIGTVEYISEEKDKRLIVLKVSNNVENLSKYRKISLDIAWWKYTGLKITNDAIAEESVKGIIDGIVRDIKLNYINVQKASYTEKVWVKIERKSEDFSIVSNYDDAELRELGLSENDINSRNTVKMYDEIVLIKK